MKSKVLRALVASIVFVVLLLAINVVHMRYFDVDVVGLDAAVLIAGDLLRRPQRDE